MINEYYKSATLSLMCFTHRNTLRNIHMHVHAYACIYIYIYIYTHIEIYMDFFLLSISTKPKTYNDFQNIAINLTIVLPKV